jgi:hypothetical protein
VRIPTLVAVMAGLAAATAAIALASGSGLPNIGSPKMTSEPVYKGYYDAHIDTYMLTDVSNKAQATANHMNYSAALGKIKGLPLQYFVKGSAAKGQITIFGSEPGETDYNPLWAEVWVTWKAGAKRVLLKSDNQINALASKGKLTIKNAGIVLNAPILTVGK